MLFNAAREGGFLFLDLAERIERIHVKGEAFLVVPGQLLLHPPGVLGQEVHETSVQGDFLFQLLGGCDDGAEEFQKGFFGGTLIGNGLGGSVGGKVGVAIGVLGFPTGGLEELPVHSHPIHRIRTGGEMLPEQAIQRRGNGDLFRVVKGKGSESLGMIPPEAYPGQTLNNRKAVFESF